MAYDTKDLKKFASRPAMPGHLNYMFNDETLSHEMNISFHDKEEIVRQLRDAFNDDTENKFRQALIDMGWTPPPAEPAKKIGTLFGYDLIASPGIPEDQIFVKLNGKITGVIKDID